MLRGFFCACVEPRSVGKYLRRVFVVHLAIISGMMVVMFTEA